MAEGSIPTASDTSRIELCRWASPPPWVSSVRVSPGADRGDADVGAFLPETVGQGSYAELRRAVRIDALAGGREHVDDLPGLLRTHGWQNGRDAVQDAAQVDIDHLIPVIDADGIHRRQRHHAGVVDQDVDAPVAFECAGREGVHAPGVGHVQLRVLGLVASLDQFVVQPGEALDPPGAEDDLVPVGCQVACGGLADTAGSAGYQHDLAVGERVEVRHADFLSGDAADDVAAGGPTHSDHHRHGFVRREGCSRGLACGR